MIDDRRSAKLVNAGLLLLLTASVSVPPGSLGRSAYSWLSQLDQPRMVRTLWPALLSEGGTDGLGGELVAVEFLDYQCPYCIAFHRALERSGVRVHVRHSPLPSQPASRLAALASICAEGLGGFRAMHDHLLSDTYWRVKGTDWSRVFDRLGLPGRGGDECMRSGPALRRLEDDISLVERLGITGTPAFAFADGRIVEGLTPELWQAIVAAKSPANSPER